MLSIFTNHRVVKGEIMDSPTISPAMHLEALAGLRRINQVSGVCRQISEPILELIQTEKLKKISLLDIACGGGDVPIAVAKQLQSAGAAVDLTLLDQSSTALAHAADAAKEAKLICHTVQANAAQIPAQGPVDVVTNSLFLHHLHDPTQVVGLLRSMRRLARRLVVISDLRRSRAGFLVAWASCRLLSRSAIVHHDGPVSVKAAWTLDELKTFAAEAGMINATIRECSPWRMLLVWHRPPGVVENESNRTAPPG
jgi:2-polyprenyl-3-methyl-5-hydroxy-6-metoxy-1,4-benzoquinol methylase